MFRPTSLDEALRLLAEHKAHAKIIAGGQSLVPLMNLRMATPDILIDLGRVADLRQISETNDHLVFGAMTRQSELLTNPLVKEFAPLLYKAAGHIGHVQTRARGTIGGSISHADPAAELPVVMVALDAVMVIRNCISVREVPALDFFESALTTVLAEDEILCEIRIPKAGKTARTCFREMSRRHGDFAIVSIAVQISGENELARLTGSIGGISETPHACRELDSLLRRNTGQAGSIDMVVRREVDRIDVLTDIYASADYRRDLATMLLTDCLREVLQQ